MDEGRVTRSTNRALGFAALGLTAWLVACGGDGSRSSVSARPRPGSIVPQRSIDVLALGMTPANVRGLYGKPDTVEHLGESETGKPIDDWIYRKRSITAEFRQVRDRRLTLAGVLTTSSHQKTGSGAGVGSTEPQLTGAVDGLDCAPTNPGERWCTLGRGADGTPQTVFVIRNNVVTEARILISYP